MKTLPTITLLFFLSNRLLLSASTADTDTNTAFAKIMQSSNDVQSVIRTLPDVENLWPQTPITYFQAVEKAAHVLGGTSTNIVARQSFISLFTNMVQKPLPQDTGEALSCIDAKRNTINYYLGFEVIRNDRERIIEIAKFIGEVRSRMIPDYKYQVVINHSVANELPEVIQEAIKENERIATTNSLQNRLGSVDFDLGHALIANLFRLQKNKTIDKNYIKQVLSAAHLTEQESKQLQGPKAD